MNLKLRAANKENEYMSDATFNNLPILLHKIDPAFDELFSKVSNGGNYSHSLLSTKEIKNLLLEKIIIPSLQITDIKNEEETQTGYEVEEDIDSDQAAESLIAEKDETTNRPEVIKEIETAVTDHIEVSQGNDEIFLHEEQVLISPGTGKQNVDYKNNRQRLAVTETSYVEPLIQRPLFWFIAAAFMAVIIIFIFRSNAPVDTSPEKDSNQNKGLVVGAAENEHDTAMNLSTDSILKSDTKIKKAQTNGDQSGIHASHATQETWSIKDRPAHSKNTTRLEDTVNQDIPGESKSLVKMCKAICHTKGIEGIKVSFTLKKINKTLTTSGNSDIVFDVPCDLIDESVSITFRGNGQTDYRNVKLKEFEIPELLRN